MHYTYYVITAQEFVNLNEDDLFISLKDNQWTLQKVEATSTCKMPTSRRNTTTKRIKWTEEIISDLLECGERALEERNCQAKRRQGYMEKM